MKLTTILKKGVAYPEAVITLKKLLNDIGISNLDASNPEFDEDTEEAVKEFQRQNHLLPDGIVGELTFNILVNPPTIIIPSSDKLAIRALEIAKTQLGVREATGHNDGKEVEMYLASVGLGKGNPYCAAFVYYCFNQSAEQLGIKNPLPKTGSVLEHWRTSPALKIFSNPQPGDIFIMQFSPTTGHTGIVSDVVDSVFFHSVESNTGSDPTTKASDRDGDGTYVRRRRLSSIKGFLRY